MRVDSPSQSQSAYKPGSYAPPLKGEALRLGHSGPLVVELQQKLNSLGAKPPLATDGLLGPRTDAAMKALLGARPAAPAKPVDQFQPAPSPARPAAPAPVATPAAATPPAATGVGLEQLPPRDPNAVTGSQFLEATRGLSRPEREQAILAQVLAGNVPDSARQFKEVTIQAKGKDGQSHTVKLQVIPDYVSIGSDADSVRIPMSPITAQKIADATGTSLPTRKIVDSIYRQAEVKLAPQPLPAGPRMMSNEYYAEHDRRVDAQLAGHAPGELVAGDKKDLLISPSMDSHPGKVIIYGWHQQNGKPIQPLSWIHENSYADYSHGVRLVSGTVELDGRRVPLADVLKDPNLAPLLSDEGALRNTRFPTD
ncbi:MAG: uncharacterized protein H6Q89_2530 [Myxococcaceae bacterium]|nr:uncharacterized protein [Myxococcaceae bacterium]